MHPFEKANLGKAPFRCVGLEKRTYQATQGAPVQTGACCDYCGTGIIYCYHIRSTDNVSFIVGSECVRRTEDSGLVKDMKGHQKAARDEKKIAARKARQALYDEALNRARAKALAEAQDTLADSRWPWGKYSGQAIESAPRYYIEFWATKVGDDAALAALRATLALWLANNPAYVSAHIGTVGKRQVFTLTFTFQKAFDSQFGTFYVQSFTDAQGNVVVYKGGSPIMKVTESTETQHGTYDRMGALEAGDTVTVKATVKAHDTYRDTNQTVISRPTVQAP